MANSSSFFQNRDCEYFPCHKTNHPENFNCLFCYCPLYALGRRCGGNFRYNERGNKDCTPCRIPHERENYRKILARYPEIMALAREQDAKAAREAGELSKEKPEARGQAEGKPVAREQAKGKPEAGEREAKK